MTKRFLESWHRMVEQKDPALLSHLVAEDAILRSPAYFKPKQGKAVVLAIFGAVMTVVKGFEYKGEWVEGNELILLFEGQVEGKEVRGIDRIVLNNEGLLTEIEVFVRPMSGLAALAEQMGQVLQQA